MSASDVELVHKALGYTAADADALKQVRAVWKKLEVLRAKAVKDAKSIGAYREFLEKSIVAARQVQALDDVQAAASEFWQWYASECERLGIAATEVNRGSAHAAWCEKWLKPEYQAFGRAYERFSETGSPQSLADIKSLAAKLLLAYVEAFKSN